MENESSSQNSVAIWNKFAYVRFKKMANIMKLELCSIRICLCQLELIPEDKTYSKQRSILFWRFYKVFGLPKCFANPVNIIEIGTYSNALGYPCWIFSTNLFYGSYSSFSFFACLCIETFLYILFFCLFTFNLVTFISF
jgi:hypothetical protein